MAFHDVRFPETISFGSSGGPERRTDVVTLSSGHEERNSPWARSRRRWEAGVGLRSLDDLAEVLAFFEARAGRLHGFRWKDWLDWKSGPPSDPVSPEDQPLGTGDGVTRRFALVKSYVSGPTSYVRTITHPVAGTLQVALDGLSLGGTEWSLDGATNEIVFTNPPGAGQTVSAGFEFDVPARFDSDRIEASVSAFEAGEITSIPVVELRV